MGSGQNAHLIRLRGPWRLESGERIKLPTNWSAAFGVAREGVLSRTFHAPTNLTPGDGVVLHVESPQRIERILLGDAQIKNGADIAAILAPSNRVTVSLTRQDESAGVLEAWIEITPPYPT